MMDSCVAVSRAPSPVDTQMSRTHVEPDIAQAPATLRSRAEELRASTVQLRVSDDLRRVEAWSLVLVSSGIRPILQWADGSVELHVEQADRATASAELDAADAEERDAQRAMLADAARVRPPVSKHAVTGGVFVALLLLAFFAVTGPRAAESAWFSEGASHAERVLHGEWWRTITALTLHADYAHVLSNVGIGAYAVGAVMRSQGVGFGGALVLASGTLGNVLNALAQHHNHSSVGFSTAVFGAIGLLGGLAYVQGRKRERTLRPAWTALGGSLALLALLGSSEQSDVFAHLFGALSGVGIGLAVGWSGFRPQTPAGQWLTGLGAAASVVGAWFAALT